MGAECFGRGARCASDELARDAPATGWANCVVMALLDLATASSMDAGVSELSALKLKYPDLPVAGRRDDIMAAMREHQVVVVVGDTGSGKTTQLPKMALELAREQGWTGRVGCTQPRRIAASSVAKRVAEELLAASDLSRNAVGYKVRFTDETTAETELKFMTDGILLAETQGDPELRDYHTIIIDEAHERSLNIDFLLGLLRNLLDRRRDLRVIISSATLDAGGFVKFFSEGRDEEVPLIEVEGRTYPVEEHYLPEQDREDLAGHVLRAVKWVGSMDASGDVLVFLPGEREIRECADVLEGYGFAGTEVLPLFARLGMADQQRIFSPSGKTRRIVLATNVAETSLTIPGIVYVIDSGIARMSRWSPGSGVQRLQIEPISQASARQRKGRCGRVSEGICVRLYGEEDFDERPEFTDPEIRRSSLAGVILRMITLGLPEIDDFPLVDRPSSKLIAEGYRTLREIGALTKKHELTEMGWQISRLPVDPRLGRMLVEARERRCLAEIVVLVAALSLMDPRERPQEKQSQADAAQKIYQHESSDFLGLLLLWGDLQTCKEKGRWRKNALRKLCRERFLNFRRILEWDNLVREIARSAKDAFRIKGRVPTELGKTEKTWANPDEIHKALLAGVPRQFGLWVQEKKTYRAAGGREFAIFPGSGLFGGRRQPWVLAMELVETSRLWARRVAKLDPVWVEQVAPHLCALRYHSAKWDVKQGAVYGQEIVMSGGIELLRRRVHYGRVDPETAREVFIRDGLLGGGMKGKPKCLKRLDWLRQEVADIEEKLRRPGGLWSEELVFAFFDEKLPAFINTAKQFHQWNGQNEDVLCPEMSDVVYEPHAVEALDEYPDAIAHDGQEYTLYYNAAPGERDDGMTIGVHIDQLAAFPDWLPSWGVLGDLPERVRLLIKSLPKPLRTQCNPAAETAQAFVDLWRDALPRQALTAELAEFLRARTGAFISAGDLEESRLPDELVTKIWVCDDAGCELAMGTDVHVLRDELLSVAKERFEAAATEQWSVTGMTSWECDALPETVEAGHGVGYPALHDEGATVGVRVYAEAAEAAERHREGCVRLLMLAQPDQAAFVRQKMPLSWDVKMILPTTGGEVDDVARVAGEQALRGRNGSLPRDGESFGAAAKQAREDWYREASELAAGLSEWLTDWRAAAEWVDAQLNDRNTGESAADVSEQLAWLMRGDYIWLAGAGHLADYPRYFKGITERIERLDSLPIVKDLEKMDVFRELWQPWFLVWSERPDEPALWEIGWLLEEYRLSLFSPSVRARGKVSPKAIRQKMAAAEV